MSDGILIVLKKKINTDSGSFLLPVTFKKVSCCPAKLAPGKSSAVADERTATSTFSISNSSQRSEYANSISSVKSFGSSAFVINERIY